MKAPESLERLIDYGIIQEVVRPLMSGKEAQVFVVLAGGEESVAKVYKEAHQRTFKHRSDYTEGRRTRNTRDQRAINKRSQHGRKKDEDAWRTAEVDMIHRLRDAGVRVPEPLNFVEGVLVMELVTDASGHPAPRLGDLTFSPREAREIYHSLIREVVRMLCAGVVHGDLSDFNVLMSHDGPVVIDFPQAVDPTQNPNARKLLLRDVDNLHRFLARFAPDEPVRRYGEEIWSLYEANRLRPDTELAGRYEVPKGRVDTDEVMALIDDASREHRMRRGDRDDDEADRGSPRQTDSATTATPFRKVVDFTPAKPKPKPKPKPEPKRTSTKKSNAKTRGARPDRRQRATTDERVPPSGPAARERVSPSGPAAEAAEQGEASPSRPRRKRARRKSPTSRSGSRDLAPRSGKPAAKTSGPKSTSSTGEAGEKPGENKPKRRRNRRRRAGAHDEAASKADGKAEAKTPKRSQESGPSSQGPRRSSGEAGDDPSPRRRRRPRKASSTR